MKITINEATPKDMGSVEAIYTHYVLNTSTTMEENPPSAAELDNRRIVSQERNLPYLVAKVDDKVVGFAYAAPYRNPLRSAYHYTVEDSIYIDHNHLGKGIGKALLDALIASCKERGYKQMIAVIGDSQNEGSIKLHKKYGFQECAHLSKVGYKFGQWIDSVMMQREL